MKKIYLIACKSAFFPLNRDVTALSKVIQDLGGDWWHFINDVWLVETYLTADQIYEKLKPQLVQADKLLIVAVKRDFSGWLPKEAWDWINQKLPPWSH